MSTFVLVHGASHGGWCWRRVADRLRAAGHAVRTPTCTGLGERAHLLSTEITLETFIQDVAGVITAEELTDIILVGHSFGGLPITGVADRLPERIRHLVYLDAAVAQNGQSAFSTLAPDLVAARTALAQESSGGLSLPAPAPAAFAVTDPGDVAWLLRRLTPQPFNPYITPLRLKEPVGNGLPRTYVSSTEPAYSPLTGTHAWVRQQQGWHWAELATGHDAMITAPTALADLLARIAQ